MRGHAATSAVNGVAARCYNPGMGKLLYEILGHIFLVLIIVVLLSGLTEHPILVTVTAL